MTCVKCYSSLLELQLLLWLYLLPISEPRILYWREIVQARSSTVAARRQKVGVRSHATTVALHSIRAQETPQCQAVRAAPLVHAARTKADAVAFASARMPKKCGYTSQKEVPPTSESLSGLSSSSRYIRNALAGGPDGYDPSSLPLLARALLFPT